MLKSMTGYGRGEAENLNQKCTLELRSLNHRFLELVLNLPKSLWPLEDRFRKLIKNRLARGRVEMQLSLENKAQAAVSLKLDDALVAEARATLLALREALGTPEPVGLDHLLHFADLIVAKERPTLELEDTWQLVSQALEQALDQLEAMRRKEGAALETDLREQLALIQAQVQIIAAQAEALPAVWQKKMHERLEGLLQDTTALDSQRLAQEVALLAERRDIKEELTRLESHVTQNDLTLKSQGPAGRKLEFLLQEMFREINTIGVKGADLEIVQAVLAVKSALERLREQVQNIE
jgi:uncharacterized protein (TIGR00255 family)